MVKAHFPTINLVDTAKRCPQDDDGVEIEPDVYFKAVMPAARISEEDC